MSDRPTPQEQKENLADLILRQQDKITSLQSELTAARDEAERLRERLGSAARIVASEPELPGDMPEEMWQAFVDAIHSNDRGFVMAALRVTVRETKDSILERLRQQADELEKGGES